MAVTAKDIASVPPVDTNGEMMRAATLLKRFRKQLTEDQPMSQPWQLWVAKSLLEGLPVSDEEAGAE